MLVQQINQFKIWLKASEAPYARQLFFMLKTVRACDLPTPRWLNSIVCHLATVIPSTVSAISRVLIHTPAFKGRLTRYGKRLYLYGGIPYVSGPLAITLGTDCRISGQTTFSGRTQSAQPTLSIGHNVDIGWQSTIAVGSKVVIGNNVRIASGAFIFGYSGHSLDPSLRAKGEPDLDCDVGDIILERDVWLGTNVTVCPNVTIGHGTIVGAGSVVTKSLPPMVIAAGNPARIVRFQIPQEEQRGEEHA